MGIPTGKYTFQIQIIGKQKHFRIGEYFPENSTEGCSLGYLNMCIFLFKELGVTPEPGLVSGSCSRCKQWLINCLRDGI